MWHTQRYLRDITLHWEQSVSKVLYVFDEAFQYQWEDWMSIKKNSNLGKSFTVFFWYYVFIHCSWKRDHRSTFVINFFYATFFIARYTFKFYRKYTRETCLDRFHFETSSPGEKKWRKVILRFFNCDIVKRVLDIIH